MAKGIVVTEQSLKAIEGYQLALSRDAEERKQYRAAAAERLAEVFMPNGTAEHRQMLTEFLFGGMAKQLLAFEVALLEQAGAGSVKTRAA